MHCLHVLLACHSQTIYSRSAFLYLKNCSYTITRAYEFISLYRAKFAFSYFYTLTSASKCFFFLIAGPTGPGGAGTESPSACRTNLTFEIAPADVQKEINFTEQISVNSAKECAEYCYSQNCITAGYVPPLASQAGSCLLAFKADVKCNQPGADRVSEFTNSTVVGLQCLQCGMHFLKPAL